MNLEIKTLYFLIYLLLQITKNNGLININSNNDNPLLLKILQTLDSATSDKKLFEVTLKLIESVCVCMQDVLRKRQKSIFLIDNNSLHEDDEDRGSEVQLYKKIYNKTCINLKSELVENIKRQYSLRDDNILQDKDVPKKYITISENIKSFYALLFQSLISTQNYHTYNIQRHNLYRNKILLENHQEGNVIIIITLYPNITKFESEKSKTFNEYLINQTLHSYTVIDIDILSKSSVRKNHEMFKLKKVDKCNLYSIFLFLMESEKQNLIHLYKLLTVKGTVKMYVDVLPGQRPVDFLYKCCHNDSSLISCKNHIRKGDLDDHAVQRRNEHEEIESYKDIISNIKVLVEQFSKKVNSIDVSVTDNTIGDLNYTNDCSLECIYTTEHSDVISNNSISNFFQSEYKIPNQRPITKAYEALAETSESTLASSGLLINGNISMHLPHGISEFSNRHEKGLNESTTTTHIRPDVTNVTEKYATKFSSTIINAHNNKSDSTVKSNQFRQDKMLKNRTYENEILYYNDNNKKWFQTISNISSTQSISQNRSIFNNTTSSIPYTYKGGLDIYNNTSRQNSYSIIQSSNGHINGLNKSVTSYLGDIKQKIYANLPSLKSDTKDDDMTITTGSYSPAIITLLKNVTNLNDIFKTNVQKEIKENIITKTFTTTNENNYTHHLITDTMTTSGLTNASLPNVVERITINDSKQNNSEYVTKVSSAFSTPIHTKVIPYFSQKVSTATPTTPSLSEQTSYFSIDNNIFNEFIFIELSKFTQHYNYPSQNAPNTLGQIALTFEDHTKNEKVYRKISTRSILTSMSFGNVIGKDYQKKTQSIKKYENTARLNLINMKNKIMDTNDKNKSYTVSFKNSIKIKQNHQKNNQLNISNRTERSLSFDTKPNKASANVLFKPLGYTQPYIDKYKTPTKDYLNKIIKSAYKSTLSNDMDEKNSNEEIYRFPRSTIKFNSSSNHITKQYQNNSRKFIYTQETNTQEKKITDLYRNVTLATFNNINSTSSIAENEVTCTKNCNFISSDITTLNRTSSKENFSNKHSMEPYIVISPYLSTSSTASHIPTGLITNEKTRLNSNSSNKSTSSTISVNFSPNITKTKLVNKIISVVNISNINTDKIKVLDRFLNQNTKSYRSNYLHSAENSKITKPMQAFLNEIQSNRIPVSHTHNNIKQDISEILYSTQIISNTVTDTNKKLKRTEIKSNEKLDKNMHLGKSNNIMDKSTTETLSHNMLTLLTKATILNKTDTATMSSIFMRNETNFYNSENKSVVDSKQYRRNNYDIVTNKINTIFVSSNEDLNNIFTDEVTLRSNTILKKIPLNNKITKSASVINRTNESYTLFPVMVNRPEDFTLNKRLQAFDSSITLQNQKQKKYTAIANEKGYKYSVLRNTSGYISEEENKTSTTSLKQASPTTESSFIVLETTVHSPQIDLKLKNDASTDYNSMVTNYPNIMQYYPQERKQKRDHLNNNKDAITSFINDNQSQTSPMQKRLTSLNFHFTTIPLYRLSTTYNKIYSQIDASTTMTQTIDRAIHLDHFNFLQNSSSNLNINISENAVQKTNSFEKGFNKSDKKNGNFSDIEVIENMHQNKHREEVLRDKTEQIIVSSKEVSKGKKSFPTLNNDIKVSIVTFSNNSREANKYLNVSPENFSISELSISKYSIVSNNSFKVRQKKRERSELFMRYLHSETTPFFKHNNLSTQSQLKYPRVSKKDNFNKTIIPSQSTYSDKISNNTFKVGISEGYFSNSVSIYDPVNYTTIKFTENRNIRKINLKSTTQKLNSSILSSITTANININDNMMHTAFIYPYVDKKKQNVTSSYLNYTIKSKTKKNILLLSKVTENDLHDKSYNDNNKTEIKLVKEIFLKNKDNLINNSMTNETTYLLNNYKTVMPNNIDIHKIEKSLSLTNITSNGKYNSYTKKPLQDQRGIEEESITKQNDELYKTTQIIDKNNFYLPLLPNSKYIDFVILKTTTQINFVPINITSSFLINRLTKIKPLTSNQTKTSLNAKTILNNGSTPRLSNQEKSVNTYTPKNTKITAFEAMTHGTNIRHHGYKFNDKDIVYSPGEINFVPTLSLKNIKQLKETVNDQKSTVKVSSPISQTDTHNNQGLRMKVGEINSNSSNRIMEASAYLVDNNKNKNVDKVSSLKFSTFLAYTNNTMEKKYDISYATRPLNIDYGNTTIIHSSNYKNQTISKYNSHLRVSTKNITSKSQGPEYLKLTTSELLPKSNLVPVYINSTVGYRKTIPVTDLKTKNSLLFAPALHKENIQNFDYKVTTNNNFYLDYLYNISTTTMPPISYTTKITTSESVTSYMSMDTGMMNSMYQLNNKVITYSDKKHYFSPLKYTQLKQFSNDNENTGELPLPYMKMGTTQHPFKTNTPKYTNNKNFKFPLNNKKIIHSTEVNPLVILYLTNSNQSKQSAKNNESTATIPFTYIMINTSTIANNKNPVSKENKSKVSDEIHPAATPSLKYAKKWKERTNGNENRAEIPVINMSTLNVNKNENQVKQSKYNITKRITLTNVTEKYKYNTKNRSVAKQLDIVYNIDKQKNNIDFNYNEKEKINNYTTRMIHKSNDTLKITPKTEFNPININNTLLISQHTQPIPSTTFNIKTTLIYNIVTNNGTTKNFINPEKSRSIIYPTNKMSGDINEKLSISYTTKSMTFVRREHTPYNAPKSNMLNNTDMRSLMHTFNKKDIAYSNEQYAFPTSSLKSSKQLKRRDDENEDKNPLTYKKMSTMLEAFKTDIVSDINNKNLTNKFFTKYGEYSEEPHPHVMSPFKSIELVTKSIDSVHNIAAIPVKITTMLLNDNNVNQDKKSKLWIKNSLTFENVTVINNGNKNSLNLSNLQNIYYNMEKNKNNVDFANYEITKNITTQIYHTYPNDNATNTKTSLLHTKKTTHGKPLRTNTMNDNNMMYNFKNKKTIFSEYTQPSTLLLNYAKKWKQSTTKTPVTFTTKLVMFNKNENQIKKTKHKTKNRLILSNVTVSYKNSHVTKSLQNDYKTIKEKSNIYNEIETINNFTTGKTHNPNDTLKVTNPEMTPRSQFIPVNIKSSFVISQHTKAFNSTLNTVWTIKLSQPETTRSSFHLTDQMYDSTTESTVSNTTKRQDFVNRQETLYKAFKATMLNNTDINSLMHKFNNKTTVYSKEKHYTFATPSLKSTKQSKQSDYGHEDKNPLGYKTMSSVLAVKVAMLNDIENKNIEYSKKARPLSTSTFNNIRQVKQSTDGMANIVGIPVHYTDIIPNDDKNINRNKDGKLKIKISLTFKNVTEKCDKNSIYAEQTTKVDIEKNKQNFDLKNFEKELKFTAQEYQINQKDNITTRNTPLLYTTELAHLKTYNTNIRNNADLMYHFKDIKATYSEYTYPATSIIQHTPLKDIVNEKKNIATTTVIETRTDTTIDVFKTNISIDTDTNIINTKESQPLQKSPLKYTKPLIPTANRKEYITRINITSPKSDIIFDITPFKDKNINKNKTILNMAVVKENDQKTTLYNPGNSNNNLNFNKISKLDYISKSTVRVQKKAKTIKYNTYKPSEVDSDFKIIPFTLASFKESPGRLKHYSFLSTKRTNNIKTNKQKIFKKTNVTRTLKLDIRKTTSPYSKTCQNVGANNLMSSLEENLFDNFGKTKLYPLFKRPSMKRRKVMRRLRLTNKEQEMPSINTYELLSHRKNIHLLQKTVQPTYNDLIQLPMTVRPKQYIIRPKFSEPEAAIKSRVEYTRPKPLFLAYDKDFYREDYQPHHHSQALSLREKVNHIRGSFREPSFDDGEHAVLERPTYLPTNSKPKFLRDRIYSIRNYLYNNDFIRSTQFSINNYLAETTTSYSSFIDPLYYFRKSGWYEIPSSTNDPASVRPTRRKRRTIYFLSPTVPYYRYY